MGESQGHSSVPFFTMPLLLFLLGQIVTVPLLVTEAVNGEWKVLGMACPVLAYHISWNKPVQATPLCISTERILETLTPVWNVVF